jgi:hypothetical protein
MFCLPGNCEHELLLRNVLHVKGAHSSLSQSRLMNRGLWIVPVNVNRIKIYGNRGQRSLVAVAPLIGGSFRVDVDDIGKGRWSRDVSTGTQYAALNMIPNENTYTGSLEQKEPKTQDTLKPITSTTAIN